MAANRGCFWGLRPGSRFFYIKFNLFTEPLQQSEKKDEHFAKITLHACLNSGQKQILYEK